MVFIQNTETNSDFDIILFSTQTKITVFTPLSDVDIFLFLYRANKTQLFFIKNTLFGTRQNNNKKARKLRQIKTLLFYFFGLSFLQLYTAITVCLARSELSISSS